MVKATQTKKITRSCYSLSIDELVKNALDNIVDWEDEKLTGIEEVDGMIIVSTEYEEMD